MYCYKIKGRCKTKQQINLVNATLTINNEKLLIFLLLVSCAKEVDDLGFRVYTIPAGEHSSGSFINHQ